MALSLRGNRDDLALPQRIRSDHPGIPDGAGVACAGAERAAKRAAVRRHPRHRACILRDWDHRRGETISAGADIRLIERHSGTRALAWTGIQTYIDRGFDAELVIRP